MDSTSPSDAKNCRNCGCSLPLEAKYCFQCSQKYTTGKVSVFSFIQEFFAEHLNLDSKLFTTIGSLFTPGKLTTEYFEGKHKSYASPLRLFLVTGILLFSAVGLNGLIKLDLDESDMNQRNIQRQVFISEIDSTIQVLKNDFTQQETHIALDSLFNSISPLDSRKSDSIDLSDINLNGHKLPKVALKDYLELKPKALVEKYVPKRGFSKKLFLTQAVKASKEGENLEQFVISKLSLGILFMMPFLALFLKILYIRQKRFYVEHLVFSFHFHAFIFSICAILAFGSNYFPDYLTPIPIIYIFVYLFLALRRVYQQSWIKTTLSYIILLSAYSMLLAFFLLLTVVFSFLVF